MGVSSAVKPLKSLRKSQNVFSGIVETQSPILHVGREREIVRIRVARPAEFIDIRTGDSICSNGVCLTVEAFDKETMTFALGAETLKITGWNDANLSGRRLNLERSLRMGDRIHGHIVTGHVDGTGVVVNVQDLGGSTQIDIRVPEELAKFFWKKGSWAVNGVSLTINSAENGLVSSCLIPETLKRTNLESLKAGDPVNLEVDSMARGLITFLETKNADTTSPAGY